MGVVLAATHEQLDQRVALKFLLPAVAARPVLVQRFLREARAAVKIHSEHVARVLDVGSLPDGMPYMVMEFLEGEDLSEMLGTSGTPPVPEAVGFVLQACEALAEAHALGIVHRDIKPANLFLARRPSGKPIVKVLDFGISKVPVTDRDDAIRTTSIIGSPTYMSPEQLTSSASVDARSDIWSIGVSIYELLTAKLPFLADTMPEMIAAVLQRTPEPIGALRPGVPEGLQAVVDTCLQKDRAWRYANVAELARALAPFGPPRAEVSVERIEHVLGVSGASAAATGPNPRQPAPSHAALQAGAVSATLSATGSQPMRLVVPGALAAVVVIGAVIALGVRGTRGAPETSPPPHAGAEMPPVTQIAPAKPPPEDLVEPLPPEPSASGGAASRPLGAGEAARGTEAEAERAVAVCVVAAAVPGRQLLRRRRQQTLQAGVSVRRGAGSALGAASAIAFALAASGARADDAACIAASEQALTLRQQGRLHDALKQLAACAADGCPGEVKAECAKRIGEVDAAIPSLVLEVTDGAGNDLHDVKVSLDGAPLAGALDGRPIALDPGEHVFRFEEVGQEAVEKRFVLRESEKDRRERVVVGPLVIASPPSAPLPSSAPPPRPSWWTPQRALGVASAGLGVVGVGLGAAFGGLAIHDKGLEQDNCSATGCANRAQANEDYSTGSSNATAATVSFLAGGVLIATGIALLPQRARRACGGGDRPQGGPGDEPPLPRALHVRARRGALLRRRVLDASARRSALWARVLFYVRARGVQRDPRPRSSAGGGCGRPRRRLVRCAPDRCSERVERRRDSARRERGRSRRHRRGGERVADVHAPRSGRGRRDVQPARSSRDRRRGGPDLGALRPRGNSGRLGPAELHRRDVRRPVRVLCRAGELGRAV